MAGCDTKVTFSVKLEEEIPGYTVYIVGDCEALGEWKPKAAKPLQLVSRLSGSEVWVSSFDINVPMFKYRFFIGCTQLVTKGKETEEKLLVYSWENMPHPRCLNLVENNIGSVEVMFGRLDGHGKVFVDRGWLNGQVAIHLSLHDNPLSFCFPVSDTDKFFIKCLPVDTRSCKCGLNSSSSMGNGYAFDSGIATDVLLSVLNDKQARPRPVPAEGVLCNPDDFISFRVETCHAKHLAFKIVISVMDEKANCNNTRASKELGTAFINPIGLDCDKKTIIVSILSRDHDIIGDVRVDILAITPLRYECDMSTCNDTFNKPYPMHTWFIGHRGMGKTMNEGVQGAGPGENTISSLKRAICHGADFVEFDVMLSKDRKPILHHDFVTYLNARGKFPGEEKRIMIPIHNLDLKELESLHTPATPKSNGYSCSDNLVEQDDQPFPLLRSCLERVDPHAGFNVEIKYCMKLRTGELEEGIMHFPGRNDYVDEILCELLHYGCSRRIILSSFDPDVCSMLRVKQNRFPVMFLTQGETEKYPQYEDPRTWVVETAFDFAVAESLHGVCVHTESLLKDPSLIEKGKQKGLWVVCWGDDNKSQENIKILREKAVDGIIVDQIDEFLIR